jgi:hypothetical protein
MENKRLLFSILATLLLITAFLLHISAEDKKAPWEIPRFAKLSLAIDADNEVSKYRIYMKSNRTTNEWVVIGEVNNHKTNSTVTFDTVLDMSVPSETVITAIDEHGQESLPTNPVKHPAISLPKRPNQHRMMYIQPIMTNESDQILHRSRLKELEVLPPPIP